MLIPGNVTGTRVARKYGWNELIPGRTNNSCSRDEIILLNSVGNPRHFANALNNFVRTARCAVITNASVKIALTLR